MSTLDLRGLNPAPVTPFSVDGDVDHAAMAGLGKWLAGFDGVKSLVVLGHAGEGTFLTADEQVGPDYLGGGLAQNLFASAEFNKAQGKIETVPPQSDFEKAVVTTFAEKASKST